LYPVAAILVVFVIIFGGAAISDSQVDDDIRSLISAQLDTDAEIELRASPFYYSKVNERVVLDAGSRSYQRYCE